MMKRTSSGWKGKIVKKDEDGIYFPLSFISILLFDSFQCFIASNAESWMEKEERSWSTRQEMDTKWSEKYYHQIQHPSSSSFSFSSLFLFNPSDSSCQQVISYWHWIYLTLNSVAHREELRRERRHERESQCCWYHRVTNRFPSLPFISIIFHAFFQRNVNEWETSVFFKSPISLTSIFLCRFSYSQTSFFRFSSHMKDTSFIYAISILSTSHSKP